MKEKEDILLNSYSIPVIVMMMRYVRRRESKAVGRELIGSTKDNFHNESYTFNTDSSSSFKLVLQLPYSYCQLRFVSCNSEEPKALV